MQTEIKCIRNGKLCAVVLLHASHHITHWRGIWHEFWVKKRNQDCVTCLKRKRICRLYDFTHFDVTLLNNSKVKWVLAFWPSIYLTWKLAIKAPFSKLVFTSNDFQNTRAKAFSICFSSEFTFQSFESFQITKCAITWDEWTIEWMNEENSKYSRWAAATSSGH